MVRGQISRLIFIDSSVNTHGDRTRVLLPPRSFTASGNEQISLTLQSFSMRRNWYNINATNNTAYIFCDGVHYEFEIQVGFYQLFSGIASAIASGLNTCINANTALSTLFASATCTHSSTSRLFSITFTKTNAASPTDKDIEIRCFAIKGSGKPVFTNLTSNGSFQDSFEILGGRPIRSEAQAANSLSVIPGSNTTVQLQSRYPTQLNTLDAVYLHLSSLETGNFQSTGFESHVVNTHNDRVVESSMFARIALQSLHKEGEFYETITFEDNGGDAFQSMITRKSLENIEIRVTDAKGRSLANIDPTQSDLGLLAYNLVLRFDIFIPREPKEPSHGVSYLASHPPSVSHK